MDERQVTIVCGPPCAGKSTYVRENMQPGDLVVDYDDIARRLGSPVSHGHDFKYHRRVEHIISKMLLDIEIGIRPRAWVIRSLPEPEAREALAKQLGATVHVVDAPDDLLMERANMRPNRSQTVAAIKEWRSRSTSQKV